MKITQKVSRETRDFTSDKMTDAQRAADLWHLDNFTDTIKIDVTLIPDHVRDNMLSQLEKFALDLFKQPGVMEEYQEWLKNRKRRRQQHRRKE